MYQVFTDGSSSRKNGSIGTSYIIFEDKQHIFNFSKGFKDKEARNGIAELLGVYYFLYHLCNSEVFIKKEKDIIIYSDSQYVVNEFNIWFRNQLFKNFYDTKNKEVIIYILWMLYILRNEGFKIKFEWVKGHQKEISLFEVYGNNKADLLAVGSHKDMNNLDDLQLFVNTLKKEIDEENILMSLKEIYLDIK